MQKSNLNLQQKKNILQKIRFNFGIGLTLSQQYNKYLGFNKRVVSRIYQKKHLVKLLVIKKKTKINLGLYKFLSKGFKVQKTIKLYRAVRTKLGLPSHGQRTKTNSKTKKKNRRQSNKFDFSNFFKYDKK